MARNFAQGGVNDRIGSTSGFTAMSAGDWTILVWFFAINVISSSNSYLFRSGNTHLKGAQAGTRRLQTFQGYSTTNAFAISTDSSFSLDTWTCLVGTFTESSATCRLYLGTLTSSIAELSYASTGTGTGTRVAGSTEALCGAAGTTAQFRCARLAVARRLFNLDEMERYRLGQMPVQDGNSSLHLLWPMLPQGSGVTTLAEQDLSGRGVTGVVSGSVSWFSHPPLPVLFG